MDAVTSRIAAAVVLAAAAAYLAGLAAGTGAAVLAALAGLALVPAAVQSADLLTRRASTSLLLGGALVFLTLTLAFDGGGYLESGPPFGVAVLALTWATGLIVAPREAFARSTPLIVAVAALTALAIWAGLSQLWSNSSALAWPGAGRALLYAMALALFGGMAGVRISAARLLRFVTLTLVGVLAAGLLARLAPDLLQTPVIRGGKRISYPLGYWNGMAFVAAAAFAFCFHLTSQRAEPALVRVLAGAAIPVIAATEFLTFSRGGLVSCLVALVVYVALTAERSMLLGASTACIAAAAAVGVVASADALSAQAKLTGSGLSEGHRVAYLLLLLTVLTAIARAAGCFVERSRPAPRIRARPVLAGVLAICLVVLGVGVALADSSVRRHLSHTFQEARGKPAKRSNDLGFINSRGRVDEWKVVLKGFDGSPLHGSGADTFANLWMVHRPPRSEAGTEAHSLYLETLGELGVVGLGLLLVALSAILAGTVRRALQPERAAVAAVVGVFLAWLVQAGVEWIWELTAASVWLFALLGACLAPLSSRTEATRPSNGLLRLAGVIALAGLATLSGRLAIAGAQSERSVQAFAHGSCRNAASQARRAISLADIDPESWRVLGYCSARRGDYARAARDLKRSIDLDPGDWRHRYDLAMVRTAGRLPGAYSAARAAIARNPSEPFLQITARSFRHPSKATIREARQQVGRGGSDVPGS